MHALIIGGNKGIGLALVNKFLSAGHEVSVTCRESSTELNNTEATIFEGVDVTKPESLQKVANTIQNIDCLIHSAGVLMSDQFSEISNENILKQFEVNALGPLNSARIFRSKMSSPSKMGFITSRMGSISDNTSGGQYGYRASKCALNAIGKSLSLDLQDDQIAIFLLHPGYVKTSMTNNNGLIETEESAEGLYNIMTSKTIQDTGTFWHTSGEQLPW